jgi:hypothetical protein
VLVKAKVKYCNDSEYLAGSGMHHVVVDYSS